MYEEPVVSKSNQAEVTCPSCGGNLLYNPGTTTLKCEHCGTDIEIEESDLAIEELDFEEHAATLSEDVEQQTITTTRCESCGAHVTFDPNIVSDRCPFCSSILVVQNQETLTLIKPGSVLPFEIDINKAHEQFRTWIKKLWFAPNKLKKQVTHSEALKGIYVPFWTYDAETFTKYRGMRGDDYTTTETYTTTENGKPVTKTRTVVKTRWSFASGSVDHFFDDVLVLASKSLPKKYADRLEPWDLENLAPFDERFLSGYRTETYQVDLNEGYEEAKSVMSQVIDTLIKEDIGGDHQRITSKSTDYSDVKFKHILLPIYISVYKFKKKVYRFLVNARTGEVQGERPYSVWKIIFTVILCIGAAVGLYYLFQKL